MINKIFQKFKRAITSTINFVALLLLPVVASANSTLYYNVQGYSLSGPAGAESTLVQFEAFAVRDGKIVAIGKTETVARVAGDVNQRIDLQGKTVLPGIIDAHGHVLGLGQTLQLVDLRDAKSEQQAVALVSDFAAHSGSSSDWILGRGWNQENWNSRQFPSATSLDE